MQLRLVGFIISTLSPLPRNLLNICYERAYNAMILKQINMGAATLMID